jgi:hypothetical protein
MRKLDRVVIEVLGNLVILSYCSPQHVPKTP